MATAVKHPPVKDAANNSVRVEIFDQPTTCAAQTPNTSSALPTM